jgi:purine-binding chemotaxis protein CheW
MSMDQTGLQNDETVQKGSTSDQMQLVTFELAGECFAVDIHAVREINRLMEITRVPQSPPEIAGVINLRGKIFPVVELRKKFGFPNKESCDQTRIVVLEFGGRETGFVVDRVHEVLRIDSSVVDPTPEVMGTVDSDFIKGIAKLEGRLLIVLDLEHLFGELDLNDLNIPSDAA